MECAEPRGADRNLMAVRQFAPANQIRSLIQNIQTADVDRAQNRALLAALYDGDPPYTSTEAKESNIEVNVNFLEGPKALQDARKQYNNAFLKPGNYFEVTCHKYANRFQRQRAQKLITKHVNRIMKESQSYTETLKAQFANVVIFGYSPVIWPNQRSWEPRPVPTFDVKFVDETLCDMSNLVYFPVYKEYTPCELYDMAFRPRTDPGWNLPFVRRVIAKLVADTQQGITKQQQMMDYWLMPEKVEQLFKESAGYYMSSAVPTVKTWHFYYRDLDNHKTWNRAILLDVPESETKPEDFLYKPTRPYAECIENIIHLQIGDLANVAPFRINAVRSLGWMLYDLCHLQNRFRCKMHDAAFESLLMYFRINDGIDRDRVQRVDLHHLGLIPEGLSIVPQSERHKPDANLVGAIMAGNRQLMSENSAAWTSDLDQGTQKEMTAAEVMARMTSVNTMVGALLNNAFTYQKFQYREIMRRFCIKNSPDKDVREFQKCMEEEDVDEAFLDMKYLEVNPVRVLGQGNKAMEIMEAQQLMAVRPLLDPSAQRIVVNRFVEANSDDPNFAEMIAPIAQKRTPDSAFFEGQQAGGLLLMAIQVPMREGLSRQDYLNGLFSVAGSRIQQINQVQSGTPKDAIEVQGLMLLMQYIGQNIQLLSEDTENKQVVKQYTDALSQVGDQVKAMAQRFQAQQGQQGPGMSPEDQAEIQKDLIVTQQKMRARDASSSQRLQQREQQFISEERRKQIAFQQEQQRKAAEGGMDIAQRNAEFVQDLAIRQAGAIQDQAELEIEDEVSPGGPVPQGPIG